MLIGRSRGVSTAEKAGTCGQAASTLLGVVTPFHPDILVEIEATAVA